MPESRLAPEALNHAVSPSITVGVAAAAVARDVVAVAYEPAARASVTIPLAVAA